MSIASPELPKSHQSTKGQVGLSGEDNKKAYDLYSEAKIASAGLEMALEDLDGHPSQIGGLARVLLDGNSVRKAKKAGRLHYKKNEGAYQEQAIKDAASVGVHTNFGEK